MGMSVEILKFRFDPEAHAYWVGNMRIPGTTEVLRGLGVIDTRWAEERDLIRGSAVHLACKFLAEKRLSWDSVDPSIFGYVQAYSNFLNMEKFVPVRNEIPTHHPLYLYGVTPDSIGYEKADSFSPMLVEIKTGQMPKWAALQTAAQAMAEAIQQNMAWQKIRRVGLELHRDGTYKIVDFTDPNDGPVFLSMVASFTWMMNAGIAL